MDSQNQGVLKLLNSVTMNPIVYTEIRDLLLEKPTSYTVPATQRIRTAFVSYYAITAKGSRARFNRSISLSQTRGAQSETAIYFYLKSLHNGCDITIMNLEFR